MKQIYLKCLLVKCHNIMQIYFLKDLLDKSICDADIRV